VPIERRGDDASQNGSLGSPVPGAAVSHETGSTSDARGASFLDADGLLDHRDAAARATASCGVTRDDGIWITECAWCKRVRSVGGTWLVISSATRADMCGERTHGICPQCSEACVARASRPAQR
jgi:hypothetical protein